MYPLAVFRRATLQPLPSLAPRLPFPCPTLLRPTSLISSSTPTLSPVVVQARHAARGTEYQPSQRKRKRKHGFLARKAHGRRSQNYRASQGERPQAFDSLGGIARISSILWT
ncbi:hypothetical protein EDB92DRAFT_1069138 [Lactarius akahatsu]|uniref:Ribosomal protein L34 n=1 Tax=Lactarius akahatsu TaxID=416441 RepID=A0AAD4LDR1_9AGAM|nr:hypothetical protein EDB92DRAFT_1069138 [Lactarius akahatsu]